MVGTVLRALRLPGPARPAPRQGQQRPPGPCQRSRSSFNTRGSLHWVSLCHRWLIFLHYLGWKELTAQAREADKDQRFFIWCSVRSWTGSVPPRPPTQQRSSWALRLRCLQSGAWRLLVPAPETDARTAMPVGTEAGPPGLRGGGLCGCGGRMALEPSDTLAFAATQGAGHTW